MKTVHKIAKTVYLIALLGFITSAGAKPAGAIKTERRAVFELGSGSIRLLVADYDPVNNRMVHSVYTDKIYCKLAKYLSDRKNNDIFSETMMLDVIDKVQHLKGQAIQKGAIKFSAIATSAFRQAKNGYDFINKINESAKINLRLVTQKEEGLCAFYSVENIVGHQNLHSAVLDIGGGSLQLTVRNNLNDFTFVTRELGAEFAKNTMLRIQEKDIGASIYPVSKTDFFALKSAIVSKLRETKLSDLEKNALHSLSTELYVVGTCKNLIPTIFHGANKINTQKLIENVIEHLNQSEKTINALYAHKLSESADTQFILSNAALLLALGEYLGVEHFTLLGFGDNTHGIILQPSYWE